jgi:hypothetical protein
METSPPVQNGSPSIYREPVTQSSEKAQPIEEQFDTGFVTAKDLINDRIERDEQTQRNPKNKNSGKMEFTAAVHDTKGKDANAGSTATACNTGGEEMDTGGTAGNQNPKQKLPKYAHPNEGGHNLPGIEKSPPRHSISPSRIKKHNAMGYIQGSGRVAKREHSPCS